MGLVIYGFRQWLRSIECNFFSSHYFLSDCDYPMFHFGLGFPRKKQRFAIVINLVPSLWVIVYLSPRDIYIIIKKKTFVIGIAIPPNKLDSRALTRKAVFLCGKK